MKIDFNALPAATRQRFCELSRNPKDPRLLASEGEAPLALACSCLLVAAVAFGLTTAAAGSLGGVAVPGLLMYLGATIAAAGAIGAVLPLVAPLEPYARGTYTFASHVVRAGHGGFHVLPLDEAEVQVEDVYKGAPGTTLDDARRTGTPSKTYVWVRGRDGQKELVTSFSTHDEAAALAQRILDARARYLEARARGDRAHVQAVDPFHECTEAGSWAPTPADPAGPRAASSRPPAAYVAHGCGALVLALVPTLSMVVSKWRYESKRAAERAAEAERKKKTPTFDPGARDREEREASASADDAAERLATDDQARAVIAAWLKRAQAVPRTKMFLGYYLWADGPGPQLDDAELAARAEATSASGTALFSEGVAARLEKWGGQRITVVQGFQQLDELDAWIHVRRTLRPTKDAKFPTVLFQVRFGSRGGKPLLVFDHEAPPGDGATLADVRKAQHEALARALLARLFR